VQQGKYGTGSEQVVTGGNGMTFGVAHVSAVVAMRAYISNDYQRRRGPGGALKYLLLNFANELLVPNNSDDRGDESPRRGEVTKLASRRNSRAGEGAGCIKLFLTFVSENRSDAAGSPADLFKTAR
jgi:hypothetical protein